jgi:hypothetical protein
MQAGVYCRFELRHVFSALLCPCRIYISEPNSEAGSCEIQENGITAAYNAVQRIITRMGIEVSRRKSEFRETAFDGIRL